MGEHRLSRATALDGQRSASSALKGIAAMVAGMAFLVMSDAVSKYLVQSHPIGQVMCLRQAACLLFVLAVVWRGAGLRALRPRNVPMQIVRGLVFICSGYLIVWSLSLLPLPTVTAITFSGPIMIALMSAPLLNERVGPSLWAATLLGFVGMLFIIQPGSAEFSWALLIPVAAAFASSVRDILARILARTDGSMAILFWSSLVLVLGTALTAPFGWNAVSAASWGLFLLAGFVNFCAHFLIIEALRLARAAVVAPLKYTSLLWSAVLGYAIWGDMPNGWVWLGAAILVASGLWIAQTQRH
ncbi:MAG: DMT family transporter [Betaproteobacteria bacterium]|nr:MAG: DMT family transporter [Betaproteobacteria bacterium]